MRDPDATPDNVRNRGDRTPPRPRDLPAESKLVATYTYQRADGTPDVHVDRWEPGEERRSKTFRPRLESAKSYGLPGDHPRVLYRLPEVLAAVDSGRTVYLCEGEKDADTAHGAFGVCATTMLGGTGGWSAVKDHAVALLHGATVVIVADADTGGRKHAAQAFADLIDHCRDVQILEPAVGKDLADHVDDGGLSLAELLDVTPATPTTTVEPISAPVDVLPGGSFILDGDTEIHAIWGRGSEVLWADGEALIIAASPGVGKTTLAVQLVAALIGLTTQVLGYDVKPAGRVLYLAMDRPRQIRRAMRRVFVEDSRALLDERLLVLPGPLPTDLSKVPDQLLTLAQKHGCDTVIVDSLKDAATKLTDDEVGGNVNRALQYCAANGIEVLVLHHQRKAGADNKKPTKLDDVYGSTWITSGAGSVICLWAEEAGSEIVELVHLKQPADPVGPFVIEHDHHTGLSKILAGFDALAFLTARGDTGATIAEAAQAEHGATQKSSSSKYKKTGRRLRSLALNGKATHSGAGGVGLEIRYYARGHGPSNTPERVST